MAVLLKKTGKNQGMPQRLVNIFLLKRKFAIGVYIKVVGQITSFLLGYQQRLKKIPTRKYANCKKNKIFQ
jgi:hypothetical protein